ncbi:MAG: Omp28-related outer membrane protein [Flavobacteriaceae bacterium]|nr:Omp28-related outer membrane protein [Flavobacteriaceae bacterium]
MKRFNFLGAFSVLMTFFLFSCGGDSGEPTPNPEPTPTPDGKKSITIEVVGNKKEVKLGETLTFVVKDENQKELKEKVVIYVDYSKIAGFSYKFDKVKECTVYAKYEDKVKSNKLKIKVLAPPSTHTTKILLEDYTGAWCGWCPGMAILIEEYVKKNKNIVPIALHFAAGADQPDPFHFDEGITLYKTFGINAFPTIILNRGNKLTKDNEITTALDKKVNLGLAISSTLSGTTLKAKVKVHFDYPTEGNNKLVVCLLENGLISYQANYSNDDANSPLYQRGNPIEDFEHNHVARKFLTEGLGDFIPEDKNIAGATYEKDFEITLPTSIKDSSKLDLVAFVVNDSKKVINVQKAKVGEDKDFD